MKNIKLCEGVFLRHFPTSKFKTVFISFNIYTTPTKDNSTLLALIPKLLASGYPVFEDTIELNTRLAELYSSYLFGTTLKNGDLRELKICVRAPKAELVGESEDIPFTLAKLLSDVIFGLAGQKNINKDVLSRELRLLGDARAALFADKARYARHRIEQEICSEEPFGLALLGEDQNLESISGEAVCKQTLSLLESSDIRINVIGDIDCDKVVSLFKQGFDGISRRYRPCPNHLVSKAMPTKTVVDYQEVNQAKISLGFRTDKECSQNYAVAFLTSDILGGGVYSKLFNNVREKKSLCYSCYSRGVRAKGLLFLESGVAQNKADQAIDAMICEFNAMKNGDFTEEDISLSLKNNREYFTSLWDDQLFLDAWYSSRGLLENPLSPNDFLASLEGVSKQDIINFCDSLSLDTVYKLMPCKEVD